MSVEIERGVPLSRFTTLGTGGPAAAFARLESIEELEQAIAWARGEGLPLEVVGLGSNVLVADDRVEALVLRLTGALAEIEIEGDRIVAGGGATNAVVLHRARDGGLGGFEFASAIPGTVGGGVRMNAGAYGCDFSQVLVDAVVVDADGPRTLAPEQLGLSYRHSGLLPGQVVARATLRLHPRPGDEIRTAVKDLSARRKETQPTNKRTFGSVFENPDHVLGAGRMLEECGLKGYRIGGAVISPRHANFIENADGATSADAIALMAEARRRAYERFGVRLEHEVRFLGSLALPPLAGDS